MKRIAIISMGGTAVTLIIFVVLSLGSCGGGGGGGGTPAPTTQNNLLSGDYQFHVLEYNNDGVSNNLVASVHAMTADGNGNITNPAAGVTYQVEADRTMSLNSGSSHPVQHGNISSSGTVAILMEAQYQDPSDTDDLQLFVGIKKSSGLTLAAMSGTYIVGQEGRNGGVHYTTRAELQLASNGTGTWTTLTHSQGAIPPPYNVTVSLNAAADGTFTMTSPSWTNSLAGILAPNADVLVMVDTNVSLTVGVRESGGTAPVMSGTYQAFFAGMDNGSKLARRFNATFNPGTMMFDCTVLALFDPSDPTGTGSAGMTLSVPVTAVGGDGAFVVDTEPGILSPDGTFFMVLDASTGDGETKIVVGQK